MPHEDAPDSPAPAADAAAPVLRSITLASAIDLDGFRRACRSLWAEQIEPARVAWHTADDAESDLFAADAESAPAPAAAPPVRVPAAYLALCESAILHSDPGRFELLYRLLWRLQHEPALRHDRRDADWLAADAMAQEVRRDMHARGAEPLGVGATTGSSDMTRRRPTDSPAAQSPAARPRPTAGHEPTPGGEAPATLAALRAALERCRECPLGDHATRAVPGEGPAAARLMFVGEQPGDQEDLQGRPFVGPAGQLFGRALAELGIDRRAVYVSNAVKHFKFELRGKRRIHKTPAQEEAAACLHWLEREIELVDPGALVALGATAARQLLGTPVAVTRQRGQWLVRGDGRHVLVTLHPSALLRMEPEDKQAAYDAWLRDLRKAADVLGSAPGSRERP